MRSMLKRHEQLPSSCRWLKSNRGRHYYLSMQSHCRVGGTGPNIQGFADVSDTGVRIEIALPMFLLRFPGVIAMSKAEAGRTMPDDTIAINRRAVWMSAAAVGVAALSAQSGAIAASSSPTPTTELYEAYLKAVVVKGEIRCEVFRCYESSFLRADCLPPARES